MRFFLLLTLLFLTSCQIINRIREEKNITKIDNQDSDQDENWKWSFEKILISLIAWIGGILIGRKLKDKK